VSTQQINLINETTEKIDWRFRGDRWNGKPVLRIPVYKIPVKANKNQPVLVKILSKWTLIKFPRIVTPFGLLNIGI